MAQILSSHFQIAAVPVPQHEHGTDARTRLQTHLDSLANFALDRSGDVRLGQAELALRMGDHRACFEVSKRLLDEDPYRLDALPVHVSLALFARTSIVGSLHA